MYGPIPVNLVVEDELSEAVVGRLLQQGSVEYAVRTCYGRGGFGYIKKKIGAFNQAARHCPFLVLTDLDEGECAPALIESWLGEAQHPNLLFRVAVREVESWLLADREGFASFLGVNVRRLPADPDALHDPKLALIELARLSRKRDLRDAIVPRRGSTATVGPDYNGCLVGFVGRNWNSVEAARRSDSLRKFRLAAASFRPVWP